MRTPPELASLPYKEPFVPSSEPFSGDLSSYGQFILNCSLVFDLKPLSYSSDKAKIPDMINLLCGRAAKWATALWNSASPVLASFELLSGELRKVFDFLLTGREATRGLLALTQGSCSVAYYTIDFRILANKCGPPLHPLWDFKSPCDWKELIWTLRSNRDIFTTSYASTVANLDTSSPLVPSL